ncbi:integrase [Vibrio cyclitrophicus]|uniref:integrase n=1 Tax=Vibrio cyclitrophicus TaxID=47951 RepID=UPI00148DC345|nr:integrase [Vibrio cyclitrophicus]NOH19476.1 integrase [Vibrio cyclitrophicus]
MSGQIKPYDTLGMLEHVSPDSLAIDEYFPFPHHVISRTKTGEVLSVFSDDIWDLSLYTANSSARIYFEGIFLNKDEKNNGKNSLADSLIRDSKLIILNLWYRRQLSVSSLMALWIQIKYLARYAFYSHVTFKKALSLCEYIEFRLEGSESRYQEWMRLSGLYNLIFHLTHLSHQTPELDFKPSLKFIDLVSKEARDREEESNRERIQTPVIPIRILTAFIGQSTDSCLKFIDIFDRIERLWEQYEDVKKQAESGSLFLGKWRHSKYTISRQVWKYIIESSKENLKLTNELKINNIQDLVNYVGYIQKNSASMISQFTGMRVSEVRSIPLNSYNVLHYGEEAICGFNSYTFKFSGNSPKKQFWVTAEQAELYYKSAFFCAKLIYRFYYSIDINLINQDDYPLFPNKSLSRGGRSSIFEITPVLYKAAWRPSVKNTQNVNEFIVTHQDVEEIQSFNPWVDFSKKGIEVGKVFPFCWHMYRRSLVVYAARGGVSIPVLANQLKHPIEKITVYYADGSVYAKNFVEKSGYKNKGLFDFINELLEEFLSSNIDLINDDIVDYEGTLFGGEGSRLQRYKNKGELPSIYEDRSLTEKEVRAGRLAYRRTVVGGCSSIKPCDRVAFTSILACIDCSNSIFNDNTLGIMNDQIDVWKEEIIEYGPDSPFSLQRQKEISIVEKHLLVRNKLIPVKEIVDDDIKR